MSWQIHVTTSAQLDLLDATDYIANTEKNHEKALSLVTNVEEKFAELSEFPYSHQVISDLILASWEIRYVKVEKYLAFYWVDESEKIVHILRFLYEKRNWKSILRNGCEPNLD